MATATVCLKCGPPKLYSYVYQKAQCASGSYVLTCFDSSEGFDKDIQLATLPLLLVQCRVILFPNSASDTLKLRLLVFQMSILIA